MTLSKRCVKCGWRGSLGFTSSAALPWFGRCVACGFTALPAKTEAEAVANWNAARVEQDQQGTVTIPL
ncbi:hypothetical protein [Burkholderia multivorans]|uniref:hypothetical protein n=1 Tax=Burkholderia multivorans TaxID=87883 RepID=UPI0011B20E43|nr:hypothetical protein [Burkholderia multivorans]